MCALSIAGMGTPLRFSSLPPATPQFRTWTITASAGGIWVLITLGKRRGPPVHTLTIPKSKFRVYFVAAGKHPPRRYRRVHTSSSSSSTSNPMVHPIAWRLNTLLPGTNKLTGFYLYVSWEHRVCLVTNIRYWFIITKWCHSAVETRG